MQVCGFARPRNPVQRGKNIHTYIHTYNTFICTYVLIVSLFSVSRIQRTKSSTARTTVTGNRNSRTESCLRLDDPSKKPSLWPIRLRGAGARDGRLRFCFCRCGDPDCDYGVRTARLSSRRHSRTGAGVKTTYNSAMESVVSASRCSFLARSTPNANDIKKKNTGKEKGEEEAG